MSDIYLLHADTTGTDSIQDIIDAGAIIYIPVPSIDVYDKICLQLLPVVKPGDTIILDTINQLAVTTRIDFRYGVDPSEPLYERYHSITTKKDQDNYGLYTNAANFIMRRLKNLYNRGCYIVCTAHESERLDPSDMRKKRNIDLNDEFRGMLSGSSSDILRLSQLTENVIDLDDPTKILHPKGTRMLQFRRTEEWAAKIQVPIDKDVALLQAGVEAISLPLGDGGWSKMVRVFGKEPRWLTLYGMYGVGKTNFVTRRGPEPKKEEQAA